MSAWAGATDDPKGRREIGASLYNHSASSFTSLAFRLDVEKFKKKKNKQKDKQTKRSQMARFEILYLDQKVNHLCVHKSQPWN